MLKNYIKSFNWNAIITVMIANISFGIIIHRYSVLLPFIQSDFKLSIAQAGMYFTFMYLSSLILAMFSGRAIDLLGSKKGMVVGICFMSFLIIIYSIASSFSQLLILAFIVDIDHS